MIAPVDLNMIALACALMLLGHFWDSIFCDLRTPCLGFRGLGFRGSQGLGSRGQGLGVMA